MSFVGKNLAIKLYNEGYKVSVMDYEIKTIEGVEFKDIFICEPDDWKTIKDILYNNQYYYIIYLNTYIKVNNAFERSEDIYERNVVYLNNFLNIMKDTKNKQIIFESNYLVYGNITQPLKETDDIYTPYNPCGVSMKAAEGVLYTYSCNFDIKTVVLRPFPFYGLYSPNELIIQQLINKININEHIYIHSDPNNIRQYLFIDDFTESISLVLKSKNLKHFSIFNVASPGNLNMESIIKTIEELLNKKADVDYWYDSRLKPTKLTAITRKIEKVLNFKPETTFKDNIKKLLTQMNIL